MRNLEASNDIFEKNGRTLQTPYGSNFIRAKYSSLEAYQTSDDRDLASVHFRGECSRTGEDAIFLICPLTVEGNLDSVAHYSDSEALSMPI